MGKIIFLQLPTSTGHFNPTKKLMNTLADTGNAVVCYGSQNQFNVIDSTKITCREYILYDKANLTFPIKEINPYLMDILQLINERIIINKFHYENIIESIKRENPDLIIYDEWLSILGYYIENELKIKCYCSNTKMAFSEQLMFDNEQAMQRCLGIPFSASLNFKELLVELDYNIKYLADIYNVPFERAKYYFSGYGKQNIVFNYPSFQPFYEEFNHFYHFIGASFEPYPDINDKDIDVYVSFGTVNNDNLNLINFIIGVLDSMKLTSVISIGNKLSIESLINYNKSKIHIFKSVNQIEILSKSKLFITHGGMNSTIEAITLGVPIIVFPQEGDQFIVAQEVNKLGIGKAFITLPSISELKEHIQYFMKCDKRNDIINKLKHISSDSRIEQLNLMEEI